MVSFSFSISISFFFSKIFQYFLEMDVNNLIGIIVGTIGGLLVLVLLIIGIVMYRKYRTTNKQINDSFELESKETGFIIFFFQKKKKNILFSYPCYQIKGTARRHNVPRRNDPVSEHTSEVTLLNTNLGSFLISFLFIKQKLTIKKNSRNCNSWIFTS